MNHTRSNLQHEHGRPPERNVENNHKEAGPPEALSAGLQSSEHVFNLEHLKHVFLVVWYVNQAKNTKASKLT